MAMAPFDEITAIYTSFHAWTYETIVAPAVYLSRHVIDDRFLTHLPQDARVLDVGCGGAKFTKYIADQRPDVHIVGIDLSKPQIARAAKLMRGYGDRVRFDIGDATKLASPTAPSTAFSATARSSTGRATTRDLPNACAS